ncbi:MAG: hypothetical protein M1820_007042 [Bogoriella megaspora]|nr:MAG: hypothetical protein M1820_007042 [Bogoriella megaspora]
MYDFAAFLKKQFPEIHRNLELEVVNIHGLVYTWHGSNVTLKPTVLMAHQDVVPVPNATVDSWTHPPFGGVYDGKYIWGRGASDCKNQLIAIMETVELLIKAEFKPKRTLILSFGFDEEISGRQGAGHIAPFLLQKYGKQSIAAIVDEGANFEKIWGTLFAKPGVGEKGYTDITVTIRMPGGHSSIPSDHTSIGVLSELITLVEAHPYPTRLDNQNPYLGQLQCGAAHSPEFPKKLRGLLQSRKTNICAAKPDHLALEAAKAGPAIKYLMQTSQAVDLIEGGVKVNALPERASAIINHRINIGEQPQDVTTKVSYLSKKIAEKYNLTLHAFDGVKEAPSSISLTMSENTLDAAPVTPTTVDPISPFTILSGTTRALYGKDIIVTPAIMTGNTDTRFYWDLSKHIFRFGPGWDPEDEGGLGNIHTVDERVSVKNHINAVKWFNLFVRNMDEAEL